MTLAMAIIFQHTFGKGDYQLTTPASIKKPGSLLVLPAQASFKLEWVLWNAEEQNTKF